ncbi:hypothetical protein PLUA15_60010 [Pseudomonas lundensis]|uniref:Uncharacterized protein n=1 Tax=Pseudomonas lundensis TaxID=86185 RepID=A0AAX2HFI7_9PSED|nr:hypothetical protein PLUA15_60010 [Pseudomonas lundensis]
MMQTKPHFGGVFFGLFTVRLKSAPAPARRDTASRYHKGPQALALPSSAMAGTYPGVRCAFLTQNLCALSALS